MTFEGDVQPQITAISLNGEDSCSGPATTTSGPQTTTTTSEPHTTASTTQQSTEAPTTSPTTTTPTTPSTTSATQEPVTTTTSSSSGSSCDVKITNSWANNIQGKISLTVPSDILEFSIVLNTDVALTGIQVSLEIS